LSLPHAIVRAGKRLGTRLPPSAFRLFHWTCNTALPAYLARLRQSDRPIVIGPWTSEVGHELLYWIPFLENLRIKGCLPRERTYVISRGGNASWYGNITDRYYNAFWALAPDDFRRKISEHRRTKLEKRLVVDKIDRWLLRRAVTYFGLRQYHVLHPMIMNILLMPIWKAHLPAELEAAHLAFRSFVDEPLDLETAGITLDGSRECVAVKFQFNYWNFASEQKNTDFVRRLVDVLSKRYTVLLLQLASPVDNHESPLMEGNRWVVDCRTMPTVDNLRVQTALLRRAKYSVTTLGGFSMLSAFVGRPNYSFYSGAYNDGHFEMANLLFKQLNPGGWQILDSTRFDITSLP